MKRTSKSAFTLVELLVVLGIVAVLSTVVVVTLNPAELIKQARDSTRISDLSTVNTALGTYAADVTSAYVGTSSVVYVSLPDSSPTCASLNLPTLPAGWTYNCATADNYKKTDGTGWIPVNLSRISFGTPLEKLPIDPKNSTSTGLYYTFVTTGSWWELTSILESDKYGPRMVIDGGASPNAFEQGTNLTLTPVEALDRGVPPDLTVPLIASVSPTSATAGDPGFTLTVNGSNFTSSSVVRWGVSTSTTTYVSPTQLTASILAGDIAATGTIAITVYDPVKGTSLGNNFAVNARTVFIAGSWTTDSSAGPSQGLGSSIVDVGGTIYIFAGGATTFSSYNQNSKVWTALASTTAAVTSGASLVKYDSDTIFAFRGGATTFWKYTISSNTWTAMASTTAAVSYGASLSYPGSGDYIYATRGGASTDLMRYSVSGNSWTVNGVGEGVGSSIVEVNSNLYLFAGNSKTFRKYNPTTQVWTALASTTAAVTSGASLVKYDSDTIYAFRGGVTTFWKYTISSDTWTAMASTTAAVSYGASLAYPGSGNYIYATRGGGSTDFWRYSVSGDSWGALSASPFDIYAGSSLTALDSDTLYTSRAGGLNSFAQYKITAGTWAGKASLPGTQYDVASLASDGTSVYALRGANTPTFYKYNPGANTWSTMANATMNMGVSGSYSASRGGITYSPSLGLFFAISGGSPGNLGSVISYSAGTNAWSYPGYGRNAIPFQIYAGSSLTALDSDTLYTSRAGGLNTFAQYKISTGIWTGKATLPDTQFGISSLTSDGTSVYALRGAGSTSFYKYNPLTNVWSTLSNTTMNMSDGSISASRGGITYSQTSNSIFAIPGSGGYILKNVSQ